MKRKKMERLSVSYLTGRTGTGKAGRRGEQLCKRLSSDFPEQKQKGQELLCPG
ncbi:MAG: hypothetical protein HDR08_05730 [Lachnospiraceae bacterium]|nr:hypothetical protein [Lachnospiraceae bacterium]